MICLHKKTTPNRGPVQNHQSQYLHKSRPVGAGHDDINRAQKVRKASPNKPGGETTRKAETNSEGSTAVEADQCPFLWMAKPPLKPPYLELEPSM